MLFINRFLTPKSIEEIQEAVETNVYSPWQGEFVLALLEFKVPSGSEVRDFRA